MKQLILLLACVIIACSSNSLDKPYSDYPEEEQDAETPSLLYKVDAGLTTGACLNKTSITSSYHPNSTTWTTSFFPLNNYGRVFSFVAPTSGTWTLSCAVKSNVNLTYQTTANCYDFKMSSAVYSPWVGKSGYHPILTSSFFAGDSLWLEFWSDTATEITCNAIRK